MSIAGASAPVVDEAEESCRREVTVVGMDDVEAGTTDEILGFESDRGAYRAGYPHDRRVLVADRDHVGDRVGHGREACFGRDERGDVVRVEDDAVDGRFAGPVLGVDVARTDGAVARDEAQRHRPSFRARRERAHLVEPRGGLLGVARRHAAEWRPQLGGRESEEFGAAGWRVEDPAGRVDHAREVARTRDQAGETLALARQLGPGLDLRGDLVGDNGDDVTVDRDDARVEPTVPAAREHGRDLAVDRPAGLEHLFVEGHEAFVARSAGTARRAGRPRPAPARVRTRRATIELASTISKSTILPDSRIARRTAKLPRIPSIARR